MISCTDKLNLEYLKDRIWEGLNMIRVFTKKPGEKPNLADEEGIILRNGATVEHCCHAVHRSIKESVFFIKTIYFFAFVFWHNIF